MPEKEKKNEQKPPRERSAAYPAISLEEAVGYSTKLQAAFSKSLFSRENAVKEMGHQTVTGASGMKVSALVHYDLLEREGNAYRNSDLALRLAHRIDENDFQEALKIAATSPKLYKALLTDFAERAVPTALSSILVRNHQIGQKVADDVARVFLKSIAYAGLYRNGIVSVTPALNEGPETVPDAHPSQIGTQPIPHNPAAPLTAPDRPPQMHTTSDMLTIELPSGIALSYPKSLTFAMAIGKFGDQIAQLNEAAEKELKRHEHSDTKDDTSSTD